MQRTAYNRLDLLVMFFATTTVLASAIKYQVYLSKKIAELMGDNINMVLEVYNHVLSDKEDVCAAVNSAVSI